MESFFVGLKFASTQLSTSVTELCGERRARAKTEANLLCSIVSLLLAHCGNEARAHNQADLDRSPGNYRELYASGGPQGGVPEAGRLLASYRFTEAGGAGDRPTPGNLKEQTLALCDRRPMAFLCLVRRAGTGVEVRVLHRMMRYFELPGDAVGGVTDLSMGLLGDVRAAQIPVVEVDNSHFSLIGGAGVRVPTIATMPDHLAGAPPGTTLGPYAANAPDTELLRPRITQVIPSRYAAILVHRDAVAPSVAYQEILGALEADGALEACADVTAWLRVACTARGGVGELAALPAVAQQFPLLLLPEAISDCVAAKVAADLPGRRGGGAVQPSMDQMAVAMQMLAENVGGAGGGRNAREPKGVAEAYRETFPVLLRYCHVPTVDDVAPLWARLANGTKSEQQSVMQQELTRVCVGRGLTPDLYCPVVTSSLKQMIISLNFAGNGPDDLTAGCHPFMVVYTGASDHYRALDQAMVANQLDQGTANASLSDIRDIREKERVKMPRDLHQVSLTLQRYAVLAHALFQGPGEPNPFVRCMWLLANTFQERLPHFLGHHQALLGTPWAEVYPSHVLRHVQVTVYEYLQALQLAGGGATAAPLPDFRELLRDLQRGSFHMSASWLPLPASITVEPSPSGLTPTGAISVTTRTTRASTASTTSGLTSVGTGGRTTTNAGSTTLPQSTYTANTSRDPDFDSLQLRPQMRELLRAHPPPRTDDGHEFCVSWWGRGGCYSNCGRAVTHRPFANNAERTRLLSHVRAHLVAAPASTAASTSNNT